MAGLQQGGVSIRSYKRFCFSFTCDHLFKAHEADINLVHEFVFDWSVMKNEKPQALGFGHC